MALSRLRASDSDDQRRAKINALIDDLTQLQARTIGLSAGGGSGGAIEIDGGTAATTFDAGEINGGTA